ncbi:hypothetical protein [Arthrobacter sp. 35W]|uniref:hypothetical protein n=1 Tax=Arthrobacter sp. 35W TaxID=1132441 RepID=UPI000554C4BF|nr:hypothetical protein [Arthrobacter sp. 35W]
MDGIDRKSVVNRHRISRSTVDVESPLSVGNGEFCFTADATGLQTFADWHSRSASRAGNRSGMPLGTQAQWAYHWAPNPHGLDLEDTMEEFPTPDGMSRRYPTAYDWRLSDDDARRDQPAGHYFWVNPQRLHLGRIAYVLRHPDSGADVVDPTELEDIDQCLDLWGGQISSAFSLGGRRTWTRTVVHPRRDILAVSASSELFATGNARIRLSFATVHDSWEADEDWGRPDSHATKVVIADDGAAHITRTVDASTYSVRVRAEGAAIEAAGQHGIDIVPNGDAVDLIVEFTPDPCARPLPSAAEAFASAAEHWGAFWQSGAAVDFARSSDVRAAELERRIVLSQYLTAIQCAGSLPPQESGLVCNSWGGTFHLEMHWWHAAHFAMWGRPGLLERSLEWYRRILPTARQNAARNGYAGARWPKHTGPEGIDSPNDIGPLLLWQQPHPIHFAELIYKARLEDPAVLERYADLVEESAEFLVSVLWWQDGTAHLAPPLMPAQERYDSSTTWDPTFELAYIGWALDVACQWRRRRGHHVPDSWQLAAQRLVDPPVSEGRYEAVRGASQLIDHPSLLGAVGFVPQTGRIDLETMGRTLDWVLESWEWRSTWGWDFPLVAMCATELDRPDAALEMLLSPLPRNRVLSNGHNFQVANRLPLYLPGNGGLLAAVAKLLTEGDGTTARPLPQGWDVRFEGFAPRP